MSDRQVVLDTETTGLSAGDGHRIIEIGCVELLNRRLTGKTFHVYLDPERDIDAGAQAVHGLSRERLTGEPRFSDIVERLTEFTAGAELLIHNASFDMSFLSAEMRRIGRESYESYCAGVVDTLAIARDLFPGRRNSLDALCERCGISNAHRKLHGALLDAELLADVYLAMTRGQESLSILGSDDPDSVEFSVPDAHWPPTALQVRVASEAELAAHTRVLEDLSQEAGAVSLWQQLVQSSESGQSA